MAGLTLVLISQGASDTVPVGRVTSEIPPSGTEINNGSTVSVVISSGPSTAGFVPDVIGKTLAAATEALGIVGLTKETTSQEASATVPAGSVARQTPVAGTPIVPGMEVTLFVSLGPPVTVPNVVGMTQAAAQAAITGAGLTVGSTTLQYSASVSAGLIMSEDPTAGSSVAPGTSVSIVPSGGSPATITLMLPGNVPLELVKIPKGTFKMGRSANELDSQPIEDFQHQVTFTYDFYLGKYPVTKAQWTAVMPMAPHPWAGQLYASDDLNSPAEYIRINNAQDFITALSFLGQGTGYRLPSEAEWEYACRAGTTTRFFWGDDPSYEQIGNYVWWFGNAGNLGQQYVHPVGQKAPNPWGLYDMGGNTMEYCQDSWYDFGISNLTGDLSRYGYPPDAVTNPPPVETRSGWTDLLALARGGTWNSQGWQCRSAFRHLMGPTGNAGSAQGFRLAIRLR